MIGFDNPAAFFFLLALPVFFYLRSVKVFSRIAFPLTISDWNGSSFSWNNSAMNVISSLARLLVVLAFVCMVVAFADPVVHHQEKVFTSRGTDILFVIDTSPSMAAKDIGGTTRLNLARNAIRTIVEQNAGQEFGLVAMAKEAAVVVPPTLDQSTFFNRLDSLSVGEMGDGTAIGTGLSCAIMHLDASPAPKKSIVLITDGENNAGTVHPHTAARLAAEKHISLYVLGVGTKGTVQIEYADPKTGQQYSGFLNSNYDVTALAQIASEADGKFYSVETVSSLSQALAAVAKNESTAQAYHLKNRDASYARYFVAFAAILLVLAWVLRRLVLQEVL